MITEYGVIVHWTRCDTCRYFGEHQKRWHTWANREDIGWAREEGHSDPSRQQCGCWCQRAINLPRRPLLHNGRKPR